VPKARFPTAPFGSTFSSCALFCRKWRASRRDVLGPLVQAPAGAADDIQAVQQIFAKQAQADALVEILVCRGDDRTLDIQRRMAARTR
jgi:hypothetical protein